MSVIHKLSNDLIPKIAAGEVIESPSGAIKELLENSIDSGATKITVELRGLGFEEIRVTDDGCGISKEDLSVCFQPFYTSKISAVEDLANIHTLGFRGEALSSLCAVSSVTIKSREISAEYGTRIEIREGTLVNTSSFGMNAGTIVEVVGLFKNIPARRKFFKEPKVEFDRVLDVFFGYALSYPDISFSIYRDGKLIHNLKKNTLENRVRAVFGKSDYEFLIPVSFSDNHINIIGYISKPQTALPSGLNQFLFVNNRYVTLRDVAKVVKKTYGTLLPHDVYPQFVIYISLSPDLVDANVHPKKQEVRFWDTEFVLTCLSNAIKNALQESDLTYVLGKDANYLYDKSASKETFVSFKDSVPLWKADTKPFELYEYTFQINNTYIATPLKEGILLVDQHAAHESILYNELYDSFVTKKKQNNSISLVPPLSISFGLKESSLLANSLELFTSYGFDLYQTSPTDFNVSSVPELLKTRDIKAVVSEMLSDIVLSGSPNDLDSRSHKTLAFLACRSAIKAGDYLSSHEQKSILLKLDECSDIYTCPHGRPVKIIVTSNELAKFFKRIK